MKEKPVSRREFLKIAGVAGATVGLAGGLGGIVAACGSEEATTTTAAPATTATTAAQTTTRATEAASTTTLSAAAEKGRPFKIGLVSATTGNYAAFSITEKWWIPHLEKAVGDGVLCADGKTHTFDVVIADCQSDSARAAQVASDLVMNSKVDALMCAASPGVGIPVQGVAEALGCPALINFTVPEAQLHSAPDGLKWTYIYSQSNMQGVLTAESLCSLIPSNKKVGFHAANDDDGMAWEAQLVPVFEAKGYEVVYRGLYQPGQEDFTADIAAWKKAGCELLVHAGAIPPDFINMWKQVLQQGFRPKMVNGGAACFFPMSMDAIGDIGLNLVVQSGFNPSYPFKDSLTGMTCQEIADEFQQATGQKQWDVTISAYATAEWLVDAFKRSANLEDKNETVKALNATKMDSVLGAIDMTARVDPNGKHFAPTVILPPCAGSQWRKSTDPAYKYDQVLVTSLDPDIIKPSDTVQEMVY